MNALRIFIESNPLSRHTVIGSSCFRRTKSECQRLKPTGRFQDTRNVPQFSMIFLDRFFLHQNLVMPKYIFSIKIIHPDRMISYNMKI